MNRQSSTQCQLPKQFQSALASKTQRCGKCKRNHL